MACLGETPLVYAVKEGQANAAQLLLAVGADPRALEEEDDVEPVRALDSAERKIYGSPSTAGAIMTDPNRSARVAAACAVAAPLMEQTLRPIRTLC